MVSPGAWRSRAKAQNKAFRVILGKSLNFSESPLFICKKKLKNPCVPYRVMVRRHIRNSISAHGQMIGKQQRFCSLIFFLMWTAFTLYWSCYNISSILCFFFFFWLLSQGTWNLSSLTRDRTCTPCIGRRDLNHWTTKEVPTEISFPSVVPVSLPYLGRLLESSPEAVTL